MLPTETESQNDPASLPAIIKEVIQILSKMLSQKAMSFLGKGSLKKFRNEIYDGHKILSLLVFNLFYIFIRLYPERAK